MASSASAPSAHGLPDDRDVTCTAEIFRAVSLKNGAHFTLRDGADTQGKGEILKLRIAPGAVGNDAFIAHEGEEVVCNVHLTRAIAKPIKFALSTKSGKKIGAGIVRWSPFQGHEVLRPLQHRCFHHSDNKCVTSTLKCEFFKSRTLTHYPQFFSFC